MPPLPSYYDVLGIPKDATSDEIRRAYRELSRKSHPDLNPLPGAKTNFLTVQEAFETLSDTIRRREYDRRIEENPLEPVKISVHYSRSNLPPHTEPQLLYALVKFHASSSFVSKSNPGINLCLVLDRSTSMGGARLDTVKAAAIELIRQMRQDDVLSAVAFSDRADVLFPAERNYDRKSAETQIRMIHGSGGTEIYQGLEAGMQQIQRYLNKSLINHILLITDGHTYGDENACLDLASRSGAQGVQITALGIGTDWNDDFLDEMTSRTGGTTYFISKAGDLQRLMREKFSDLNQVFAEKVLLEPGWQSGVEVDTIFRLQPDPAPISGKEKILLGNIFNTVDLSVIFELVVHPSETDEYRRKLMEGSLSMILPFDRGLTFSAPLQLNRVTAPLDQEDPLSEEMLDAVSRLTLFHMQARALKDASEGNYEAAGSRLQNLAKHLYTLGEIELAQTALKEADRIRRTKLLSAEGQKMIKYATRALLLPGTIKEAGVG